ncbi:glycosyltransferase [Siphonobacter sp. SORGH_AS_0500]|uniref:WecB/TagA/CpsF family glycosyltransferase n=1 Tax=Siphonobacter sp. SORGH_AS_0500 TaxID=1864824 RepID=UPI000CB89EBE|nr:WecB/TagA/CpsF family glycosyltransferase [Siphonobacter sp. SORGH_AS_0500]PKK36154.1 glycosyltransferase [Siphonobacter sp. SORGH_AS_0500]
MQLISIKISSGPYQSFIDKLVYMACNQIPAYCCVANVHMLVEAYNNEAFASIVNNADLVTPDGMPLTWGLKLVHGIQQDRVAGMDLLPDLLAEASKLQLPVYFYGGTQAMLDQTDAYIRKVYPSLHVAGMYSPPFRPLTAEEDQQIVDKINASGARMIFVALGCPKQEKWMASMKGRIQATMIGIGGALPVMVGMQKRAPEWMQKASLEWLYRLVQEPKRLFKRYAVTNTTYLWLLTKELFTKKRLKTT